MTDSTDSKAKPLPASDSKAQGGAGKFFQEAKQELDKVVWPSRQQLVSESAAVLLMVVASASLIYLIDGLFSWVAGRIF